MGLGRFGVNGSKEPPVTGLGLSIKASILHSPLHVSVIMNCLSFSVASSNVGTNKAKKIAME